MSGCGPGGGFPRAIILPDNIDGRKHTRGMGGSQGGHVMAGIPTIARLMAGGTQGYTRSPPKPFPRPVLTGPT